MAVYWGVGTAVSCEVGPNELLREYHGRVAYVGPIVATQLAEGKFAVSGGFLDSGVGD